MATWAELEAELAAWEDAGRTATLWWRDDDAVAPGPALTHLTDLSERHAIPLALAVVPAGIDPELAPFLETRPLTSPLQHGFAHRNHAPDGEKSAEFGPQRPGEIMAHEIAEGWQLLGRALANAAPVFVPPWNRIAPALVPDLAVAGLRGLSTFAPRQTALPHPAIRQVNTHVDIIAWRAGRCFAGEPRILHQMVDHLRARRLGDVDAGEPTGLLTHHLVHDVGCWAFVDALFELTRGARSVSWLSVHDAFALGVTDE